MPTGHNELDRIRVIRAMEKRKKRKRVLIAVAVLVTAAFLYMCIEGREGSHYQPVYVARCLAAFIRYRVQCLWADGAVQDQLQAQLQAAFGNDWAAVVSRLKSVLLIGISGAVLALSGTVYQTSMRNPMAVPTMLGVSSGVQLAQMVLILLYAEQAYYMPVQRYALSYGISIGVLLAILGAARIVGRDRANIADLLIVGTIVNRLFQIIMNYYQSQMDDTTLELYQEFAQNSQDYYNDFSDIGVLILISGVVLLPLILMRFSFNVVSFEDEDAHAVGVKSKFLRFYGIFAGGVLTATAMIHAGNVGMLATVVPLMCRYLYGADFRDLLWASALWGGVILLFSEFVRSYTYINEYQIPLGNIVSLLAIPLLIWIIRRQQKIFPSMER